MVDGRNDLDELIGASDPHHSPGMPPAIAAAVLKVMGQVKQLGWDARNEHGRYNYASIDSFMSAMRPLLAEAGIFIVLDEASVEVRQPQAEGKSSYLFLTYNVSIVDHDGTVWGPMPRRCYLPATGPQAFGAAESYVLKRFMRNLFQVPTGEQEDADALPAGDIPAAPTREAGGGAADKGKAAWDLLGSRIRSAETLSQLDLANPQLVDDSRMEAWDILRAAHQPSYDKRVQLWRDRLTQLRGASSDEYH